MNEQAQRIVAAILNDLTDRRGLRQAWESIDEDVQQEIVSQWTKLAHDVLNKGPKTPS